MKKQDFESSDSDESSQSENEAEMRVRKLMDRIFKKGEGVKTQDDVDKMADNCSKMLESLNLNAPKNKSKKISKKDLGIDDKAGQTPQNSKDVFDKMSKFPAFAELLDTMKKTPELRGRFEDSLQNILAVNEDQEKPNSMCDPNIKKMYQNQMAELRKMKESIRDRLGSKSSWRQKIEGLMNEIESQSSGSSDESDIGSKNAVSKMKQIQQKKSRDNEGKSSVRSMFAPSKEDFDEATKKAQDWLRSNGPDLMKERFDQLGFDKSYFDDMPSFEGIDDGGEFDLKKLLKQGDLLKKKLDSANEGFKNSAKVAEELNRAMKGPGDLSMLSGMSAPSPSEQKKKKAVTRANKPTTTTPSYPNSKRNVKKS